MKMYTVDNKLLTECPEIRIGDKVYPIDDRQKTVEKMNKIASSAQRENMMEMIREVLKLALGKDAAKEIDDANYPFAASLRIFETVAAAMTGETPDQVSARFQSDKNEP